MERRGQSEGADGLARNAAPLRRSGAIALVLMVDQPYFRVARGEDGGVHRAGFPSLSDVAAARTPAGTVPSAHPVGPSHARGLGLFGDTMLDSDLSD